MKTLTWLMVGIVLTLGGCSRHQDSDSAGSVTPVASQGNLSGPANTSPAEVNCMLAGGRMGSARQLNGALIGTCLLANGKRCDENALLKGTCPAS
ncbi:putative hemolysin [Musicola paradisiaca]|uniref:DUF333 domain-containing protein n=1 Tax=Musicola paradisiaca (strain Ech703) TaxID=579405 RepID=C6C4G4_MUSP7|nr:DUF333 domain-containing protein [Musicola paradisiaca]ACS85538.1 protein of unknown function DUF333 [Musicola paradisiaca Ech703]